MNINIKDALRQDAERLLGTKPGHRHSFASRGFFGKRQHLFEREDLDALFTAIAAQRPLLVLGEPGAGKSQLALAAADLLERPLLLKVVDARTEARDLRYSVDLVQRLGDAQMRAQLPVEPGKDGTMLRDELRLAEYVRPEALWWAFDWESAHDLRLGEKPTPPEGWSPRRGCVVLIDELDKAEAEVPNGLLVDLGEGHFERPDHQGFVDCVGVPPLVVVTSNEERELPDAFLRRCVVHHMGLPRERKEFISHVVARGRAHFPSLDEGGLEGEAWVERVAADLHEDRERSFAVSRRKPGLAEYLDVLRVLAGLEPERRAELYPRVRRLTLAKFESSPSSPSGSVDSP